jgi:small subunit ribosomal protein S11
MAEMEKKPTKTRRREKKNVPVGQVHIAASFNNTVISITDPTGAVLSWGSGGVAGFKGSRKSTPYAASLGAEAAARKAMEHGLRSVEVFVKGPGAGREQAIRGLRRSAESRRGASWVAILVQSADSAAARGRSSS